MRRMTEMRKKRANTAISMMLAAGLILGMGNVPVSASQSGSAGESGDNVVVTEEDKPYLALGADLTADQQHTVLDLMGIDSDDLSDYNVVYVNNSEEHQYLDDYISSSEIGTKSLSSVVIMEAEKGSGLSISTYNINYCTVGMYKNALTTAGITDANIIVAGPFELSGTCALVGIIKAYEEMSGETVDDDMVDAAMDELVTTGELNQMIEDADPEEVEAIIADLKEELAKGALDSEDDMRAAIAEICEKYGVTLTDEETEKIVDLLKKLKGLNLDLDSILSQADQWKDKLGELQEKAEKVNGIMGQIQSTFDSIVSFFKQIFGK